MATKPEPASSTKPSEKMIKCRVVGPSYGLKNPKFRGETVEVTEAEYNMLRVTETDGAGKPTGKFRFPVLLSLEDEEKQRQGVVSPDVDRKRAELERARAASNAERDRVRDEMMREHYVDRAKTVIASGGLVGPQAGGPIPGR